MSKVQRETSVVVPLTIRVVGLPSSTFEEFSQIKLGIQRGKAEVLKPTKLGRTEAIFTFDVHVKSEFGKRPLTFLGPYTQGPPSDRFVYLSWSGVSAGRRERFRRIKVSLKSITSGQIQLAKDSGCRLEARISGIARDGGPACATVPLLGMGWIMVP